MNWRGKNEQDLAESVYEFNLNVWKFGGFYWRHPNINFS
jgi:hypothetical protein